VIDFVLRDRRREGVCVGEWEWEAAVSEGDGIFELRLRGREKCVYVLVSLVI
jgi:hypothetical protein